MWHILSVATLAALATLATPASTQQQFAELGKRHLPADRDPTLAVAMGDVDGDGDLDVVFANGDFVTQLGRQNRLHLNDGNATFTDATAVRMPTDGEFTHAVALGDVDGDGDLDLVFGNKPDVLGVGGQNRLYLNDGQGQFADATAARMPTVSDNTHAVAMGDVDGDGDLDLVFGNPAQQNRLYLNDGTGRFTDATAARMPTDNDLTYAVAMGDVDRDGDLDLVFGNAIQQNRLYLNDGTGQFTDATAARMPTDSDFTYAVATGDVDGDGDLDLVFGNASLFQQNRLYLNDGSGSFNDATAARLPTDSDDTHAVAMGDVDRDGDLDLAFGNWRHQNRLYLNDGTGTFTDATATRMPTDRDVTYSVAMGDADGDGDLDLVSGNSEFARGDQNRLYLNDGTGRFTDGNATRLPSDKDSTHAGALGDADGDGDLDLVFGTTGQNRLHLNDGTGQFTDATAARMPTDSDDTKDVVMGDVDRDGDLDLAFGNAGQNRLYLNDGNGRFTDATAARMPIVGDYTLVVAMGDVDRDGDLDMVFGNAGQNRLYLNDGNGRFTDATSARLPTDGDETHALALGDVDGDGDLDVVVGNGRQQNRLYLNDGTGQFTDATAARMPGDSDDTRAAALSDVNSDGDLDLVVGNFGLSGQQNRLYLNDGTGQFTDATAARMPMDSDDTFAAAPGDVDGDGDLDLIFGNLLRRSVLYLNDGNGHFADASAARMPSDNASTHAAAMGDVDGDGDLDLVFGNDSQQNRLYLNLHRQLDTPFLARLDRPIRLDSYAEPGYGKAPHVALPFLNIALAPTPLPVPPLGTLYVEPVGMVALPWVSIPLPAGLGSLWIDVPGNPALIGLDACVQALIVDLANPGAARLTNHTAEPIRKL